MTIKGRQRSYAALWGAVSRSLSGIASGKAILCGGLIMLASCAIMSLWVWYLLLVS